MREFYDPEKDPNKRCHIGTHPLNKDCIRRSKAFRPFLRDILIALWQESAIKAERGLVLAIFCKSGRHRSVAGLEIVEGIFTHKGIDVYTEHLCVEEIRRMPE